MGICLSDSTFSYVILAVVLHLKLFSV